jgi:lauroyl/myristoyl acyltransferase
MRDLYSLVVIILIKIVGGFSSPLPKEIIVKSIALAAYYFSENKRRLIEKNLSEVFDRELGKHRRREIVKGAFHEFWRETFSLVPSSQERAAIKSIDIRGLEHLQRALGNGKGVILWESNSFGGRALSKQILHETGFSIHQVYAEGHLKGFLSDGRSKTWVREHIIKREMEKFEKPFLAEIIYLPSSDSLVFTRILLDRLKQNAILCIPADGRSGKKFAPLRFLGHTELFPTGMVSLARISGAFILPIFCSKEDNRETSLIIEPPIRIEKEGDRERVLEKGVSQYVNLLESYIRRYPKQYRNWNSLWKIHAPSLLDRWTDEGMR